MSEYFSNLMSGWLENAPWVAELPPRAPIVYIATGIFGVLLFVGFIASMLAIGFTARRHADTAHENRFQQYHIEQERAAKIVISTLRSAGTKDEEIREILIDQYHFNALTADALLVND